MSTTRCGLLALVLLLAEFVDKKRSPNLLSSTTLEHWACSLQGQGQMKILLSRRTTSPQASTSSANATPIAAQAPAPSEETKSRRGRKRMSSANRFCFPSDCASDVAHALAKGESVIAFRRRKYDERRTKSLKNANTRRNKMEVIIYFNKLTVYQLLI